MFKKLLIALALVGVVFAGTATTAQAAPVVHIYCPYHATAPHYAYRSGNHWMCITPGAYCPKIAHWHYGYARVTGNRYRCMRYVNSQWRWKHAF